MIGMRILISVMLVCLMAGCSDGGDGPDGAGAGASAGSAGVAGAPTAGSGGTAGTAGTGGMGGMNSMMMNPNAPYTMDGIPYRISRDVRTNCENLEPTGA